MSLRLKLLAAFAYVLVLVLIALEIPLVLSLSSRVDSEVRSQAAAQAQVVAAAASARIGDRAQLQRVVEQAGRDLGARVIVVGPRGRLLADSAGTGLRSESYADRPEIAAALAGRSRQGTRHSDTVGEELLFTAVPILDQGRTVGAVRVTQSNARRLRARAPQRARRRRRRPRRARARPRARLGARGLARAAAARARAARRGASRTASSMRAPR